MGNHAALTPGTIAIMSGELGRYRASDQCFAMLEVPPGTSFRYLAGSVNIAGNRNTIASTFRGDWLLMIDDDMVYARDTLARLLSRFRDDAVDVVVPYSLQRRPPCQPTIFRFDEGQQRLAIAPVPAGASGLLEVDAAATAMILIRRRAFERAAAPWFEVGQLDPAQLDEDISFCRKVRAAGCRVFCDLDVSIGHIAPMAIFPTPTRVGYQTQWILADGNSRLAAHATGSDAGAPITVNINPAGRLR